MPSRKGIRLSSFLAKCLTMRRAKLKGSIVAQHGIRKNVPSCAAATELVADAKKCYGPHQALSCILIFMYNIYVYC
jgi:hypothetical protein